MTRQVTLSVVKEQKPKCVKIQELSRYLAEIDPNENVTITVKNNMATIPDHTTTNPSTEVLAKAFASTKAEGEQKASQIALDNLNIKSTKNLGQVCL